MLLLRIIIGLVALLAPLAAAFEAIDCIAERDLVSYNQFVSRLTPDVYGEMKPMKGFGYVQVDVYYANTRPRSLVFSRVFHASPNAKNIIISRYYQPFIIAPQLEQAHSPSPKRLRKKP
ncbi:uncharacterized protein UV8b_07602 [Ustilaginoidea virens]|uniref:Uncharacterized protein n=1 Tax=Ustilaginoidea virens TaxID=1159556 RepID=A0A8E5MKZ0_USTVR|nr:uncharacterized protein UV8b_07602 [Ustilaginoidea virens]QUC23361.1 hypothetical protein UV8b_07602 [Ustilaginoidea virens]